MKIYTEVNWQWDDILKKYIEISSNSFEYGGDLDLAADDDEGGDDEGGEAQESLWIISDQPNGTITDSTSPLVSIVPSPTPNTFTYNTGNHTINRTAMVHENMEDAIRHDSLFSLGNFKYTIIFHI